ncbi:MAG: PEGA domain-containing protein [Ignavibacteria bacterium]|nr:PEGA domain-containing protein [Ignavibacteria bacterium]
MKNAVPFYWIPMVVIVSCCVQSCDEPEHRYPTGPPVVLGSLRILVNDPSGSSSYAVEVDGLSYGKWSSPCVVPNIPVGTREIVVFSEVRSSPVTKVEIKQGEETSILVSLLPIRPYVGDIPPQFSASSVDGEAVTLKALRGKVVVLAFFGSVG